MTITYGFFDSVASDRLYNAKQMGSIFDGLILDGVYPNYGDRFEVLEDTGMDVSVGTGRSWFDHTWTYNDALFGVTVPTADVLLDRIDIVYLEVNEGVGVRANKIDILEGTPASTPIPPTLTNTSTIHQYALAHIYVAAGVTNIYQADITDMVGTVDTPFVELVTISEDMQAQIYAIVGDTNPPLIDLIEVKIHDHTTDTPPVEAGGLATDAVQPGNIADDAVQGGNIAPNAVQAGNIQIGGVSAANQLAYNVVENNQLGPDAVDDLKVGDRVPAIPKRQGGSASDWGTPGTSPYTPGAVRIQVGSIAITLGIGIALGTAIITFPDAFSNPPLVFYNMSNEDASGELFDYSHHVGVPTVAPSATQCRIGVWRDTTGAAEIIVVHWMAIGPE